MSRNVKSTGNTSCRRLNFEQENNSSGIQEENNAREDEYVDLEANEDVLEGDDSEIPEDKIPKFGMKFDSEDSAYQFYNDYARALGFSIRRTSSHKDSNNNILDRKFCCSCQGQRGPDKRDKHVKSHRPETRFSCHAHMRISARGSGKYVIVGFVPEHNGHDLVSPNKTHFLRSQRKISAEQAAQIENFEKSGIPPKASMDYMAQQVGGRENVGFILEDLKNYLHSKRTMQMKEGDARGVHNYLQLKQSEDPNFFYAVQVDKDDLITNIFWADGQMMVDYIYFGDVVSFDTTYRKNKEGRPFALFVGVNHHKQTTVFRAALLYDETAETFMWLFDTFVKAMNGKKPITILTDQDAAMAKALEEKWPETRHRLCIWHIYQNAAVHLSHIFAKFSSFTKDLNSCIYDYEDEEDFLEAWQKMLDKYSLQDNDWLVRLFKKKEKWAMVYGRQTFCADMIFTQRSESMNSVLKKYVSCKNSLLQFLQLFDKLVDDRRYKEMKADFRTSHSTQHLPFEIEILKHARDVYTHEVFKLFQQEWSIGHDSKLEITSVSGDIFQYKITPARRSRHHTVTFNASDGNIFCSCQKFEFAGILCSHALKVLTTRTTYQIPEKYVKKRWTKKAKKGIVEALVYQSTMNDPTLNMEEENEKIKIRERYRELCRLHNQLTTRAALTEETFEIVRIGLIKMSEEVDGTLENKTSSKPTTKSSHGPKFAVKKTLVSRVAENQPPASQTLEEQPREQIHVVANAYIPVESSSDEVTIQGLKTKQNPKIKSGKRMKSGLEQAAGRQKVKHDKKNSNKSSPNNSIGNIGQGQKVSSNLSSMVQSVPYSFPPSSSQLLQSVPYPFPPSSSQLLQNYQVGVSSQTPHINFGIPHQFSGQLSYVPQSLSLFSQNYQAGVPSHTTHQNLGIPYHAPSHSLSYVPPSLSQFSQNYQVGVPNQTPHQDFGVPYHARGHVSYVPPHQTMETQMLHQQEFGRFISKNSTTPTKEHHQQEFGRFISKNSTTPTKEQNASRKDGSSQEYRR